MGLEGSDRGSEAGGGAPEATWQPRGALSASDQNHRPLRRASGRTLQFPGPDGDGDLGKAQDPPSPRSRPPKTQLS